MKKRAINNIVLISSIIIILFSGHLWSLFNENSRNSDIELVTLETEINNLKLEIEGLQQFLTFEEMESYEYLYGRVIFRDIYEFFDRITISLGEEDGVENYMAVINHIGLVGIVVNTSNKSATISLVTNPNNEISVKVNNTYGILKSNGENLIVSDIVGSNSISIGDIVYTSGLGNLPGNIYIGRVKEVINLEDLSIQLILEARNDVNNLKHVAVIGSDAK